jgi:hypothetical protein
VLTGRRYLRTPVVERWQRFAKLAKVGGDKPLDSGTLSLLLAQNVDSLAALRRRKVPELHEQLRKAATDLDVVPPTQRTIQGWMRRCRHSTE